MIWKRCLVVSRVLVWLLLLLLQVVPGYMSVVHGHRLLRRLLTALVAHLRRQHHGLTRIYFFR
jgi:hypothetical protein